MSRVEGVRRIAVLRPNAVGDFVFALPALAALRAAYPEAHLVLLGRRWHREFLQGRPGPVDEVIEMPTVRGVGAPLESVEDEAAVQAFVQALRERRFDLAVQLYGGGRYANPFIHRLQARVSIGMRADDAPPLQREIAYRPWRNERLRLLEVAALAGAQAVSLAPRLALLARDEAELLTAGWVDEEEAPWVVLQPGATDPRRRWPAERFAAVGDALAEAGARIAINGSVAEQPLAAAVRNAMRAPALDLSGRLSLGGLAALLARARLVVSNDTGPLHLAQAVGTPTVGIYWFMNLLVSAPLVAGPHREAVSPRSLCPVCGQENLRSRCPHDVSFVDDVPLDEVQALSLQAFSADPRARARRTASAPAPSSPRSAACRR